jgi:tRNA-binding protein
MSDAKPEVTFEEFEKLDIRVGTVLRAQPNPQARNPAFALRIDFGDLGVLESSAQITQNYTADSLVGMQVIAVVNFPPKRVAGVKSQCLVLGAVSVSAGVVCLTTTRPVENGSRVA